MDQSAQLTDPIEPNPAFCILPWIHLSSTVDGVWGRCCFDATNDYEHYYEQAEEPAFASSATAVTMKAASPTARS